MPKAIEKVTHFLNIDLEVWSRRRLDALVEGFGESNLYVGPMGRLQLATFEALRASSNPDVVARALVSRARKLSGEAKKLWEGAVRRDFNVGIQGGLGPRTTEVMLSRASLRAIFEIGGSVVITVYGTAVTDE